ncbi:tetratricopeptide repeat protein [Luteimonas sp. BDR2-5]|uniref:tetratricopeptide repeat protein n=1 Tax=Proluteimonas luteida TaxID=2878685 RepID=UPI001E4D1BEC|nr:tetratricopeptide repeat protein [Luteimonas sp. BDR2-5]MCD9027785.1 tetratricopeptide repeat protein [Luteimonas sp. BDR2-5]
MTRYSWPMSGLVLCGLLLAATTVSAQSLPAPAEFYFDEDARVATPVVAIAGDDEATYARLQTLIDRNARNADQARAQLAHALMRSGRTGTGRALYDQLLAGLSPRSTLRAQVQWNYGWDLYRDGAPDAALAQWAQAVDGRLVRPAWAPPTLALALWRLDRKPEAVRWYAAAVRTEPQLWSDPARFPQLLPDWRDADRAVLAEVFAAWRADPPAWP